MKCSYKPALKACASEITLGNGNIQLDRFIKLGLDRSIFDDCTKAFEKADLRHEPNDESILV